jgi:hypothetical protein
MAAARGAGQARAQETAHARGRPRRERHRDGGREAEREHHVRKKIERKSGGDAAGDRNARAAAPLHAQAEAGGDQHHGGKEQRAREQRVEIEPVPERREARIFKEPDEARQLPERHGLRRGEAVLNLARREVGWNLDAREALQRLRRPPDRHVVELPFAVAKPCLARVDPFGELAVVGEEQHGDPAQRVLVGDVAVGVDDRVISLLVALPQPQARPGERQLVVVASQDAIVEPLVARLHDGGDRIEDRDHQDADEDSGRQGRRQKLPDRNARRARHHQLVAARQMPERHHGSEQDDERHDLLRHVGLLQERHLEEDEERCFGPRAGAANELDIIEQEDDAEHRHEDAAAPAEELARDIAEERLSRGHGGQGAGRAANGASAAVRRSRHNTQSAAASGTTTQT